MCPWDKQNRMHEWEKKAVKKDLVDWFKGVKVEEDEDIDLESEAVKMVA
jgi:hypothetical protein